MDILYMHTSSYDWPSKYDLGREGEKHTRQCVPARTAQSRVQESEEEEEEEVQEEDEHHLNTVVSETPIAYR
jgi:hypothetical protein